MIYYSNATMDQPHLMFVGRFTPFHKGHIAIIQKKRQENPQTPILIQVRSTNYDQYSPEYRAEIIKLWMKKNQISGTIMLIPDIQGIYWGRQVGYQLEEVNVDEKTHAISASHIRSGITTGQNNWKDEVASQDIVNLLVPQVSKIIENGAVIWLTGCPGSGKSTISHHLQTAIRKMLPHLKIQLLDGDDMRETPISEGLGYSSQDRALHIRRMGQLAKMFADHGILVIATFVSPDQKVRQEIRTLIGEDRFFEIYVKSSRKNRITRDTKGLYAQAKAGKIKNLTGYNATYEVPINPNLVCNTDHTGLDETIATIIKSFFRQ